MTSHLPRFIGIVVLMISLTSCKISEKGRGKPLTQRAMSDLATGLRLGLRGEDAPKNFERMSPEELFEYMDSVDLIYYGSWLGHKEVRDAWENSFKIRIRKHDFTIESPGKDRAYGTEDDMTATFLISP